jgi:hypothetical protein
LIPNLLPKTPFLSKELPAPLSQEEGKEEKVKGWSCFPLAHLKEALSCEERGAEVYFYWRGGLILNPVFIPH